MTGRPTSRRALVGCLGAACAAGLAGCAEYGATSAAPASQGNRPESPDRIPTTQDGAAVAAVSDVPVGGAVILAESQVVLTQPTAGRFLAFSNVCTHQGCPVTEVADDEIVCACHGSRFALDGSVVQGPATTPLPPLPLQVRAEELLLG